MSYRLLLLALLLTGCGQKGPLYLPAKPAPAPLPEASAPAADSEQEEKKKKEPAPPVIQPE